MAVAAAAFVAVGVRIGVALAVLLASAVEGPAACVSRAAAGPFADRAVVVRLPGRAVVRRSVVPRAPGLPLDRAAGSRCAVPVAERWRLAPRGMLQCADRVATPLSASGAAITAAAITGAAITAAIILGVASLPVSWQVLHWEPLLRAIRTILPTIRVIPTIRTIRRARQLVRRGMCITTAGVNGGTTSRRSSGCNPERRNVAAADLRAR